MKRLIVALLFSVLSACSQFGLHTESTQDKIAASEVAVAASYGVIADLLTANKISKDDGRQKYLALREAEATLKIAEAAMRTNDLATAEGKLRAANEALAAVNAYLVSKKGQQ